MFINGSEVKNEMLPFGTIAFNQTYKKMNIGCRESGGTASLALYGKMSDFVFYNKDLNSTELDDLWNGCRYANSINNTSTTLVGTPTQNVSYQWYNCATQTAINGATNRIFTPSETGNFALVTTYNYGIEQSCTSDTSECVAFTVSGVGMDEYQLSNALIYPNPTIDIVNISNIPLGTTISLTDAAGRLILTKNTDLSTTSIDVSNQVAGVYFINLKDDAGNSSTKKLIVRK